MIVLALALSINPMDGFATGQLLEEDCASTGSGCEKYVVGVTDAMNALATRGVIQRSVCMPLRAKPAQLKAVVTDYLADHPEARKDGGAVVVFKALAEAFPCTPID
ncbi:Rap1a/Tai family immunity protein [Sphingobium phenoxybenzoativorans]|uniref:Rap1a/Tai family immunity protein n=1 Tax=Sphingobium phenoxybenzoativorans TaxID=1592790 RepID=UPI00087330AA|nr:Rap1a/Tai family immunity protein [Sphingobium phenoxybenzoativorans]